MVDIVQKSVYIVIECPLSVSHLFFTARSAPFKLSVFTDGNEDLADVAGEQGNNQANVNEISTAAANEPLGTQGFSIGFAQISCS